MRQLPIGEGAVALDVQLPVIGSDRQQRAVHEDCRGGKTVGMYMRTAGIAGRYVVVVIVGRVIRRNVVRMSVMAGCRRIMHMRVNKGMRFGKLRRVQDRQLAAAEHCHGKQRRNHDLLDDPAHMHTKPAYLTFVKGKAPHPKPDAIILRQKV
ncbi:MAG: hypothetical protein K8F92_14370 [Hyphomicrobium sp.]|uniref:hypothetical protein n=1 Tax=Hyphomicrobium sp. TaxID=82 RepID=UPI00132877BF|nr:hypothetical protein [Hyphomicrobium sp.]KAB2942909.1 MAG: hypothetical protein F9K20_05435 [Hyphomicrobium sp.]MBZ0210821.1 hypothetical protein [Hyphomicrobium sp.]MCZ7595446.1 hypothetical protein [Hyphomicrobium sp.]